MAIKGPIPVAFGDVFPQGAFALSVEGQRDFDKSSRDNFVQATTGEGVPLWVVHVIDGDTEARNNQLRVKIAATEEPVLPEPVPNTNFAPVEFTGLQVRPYVDRQSGRLAYSFTATGLRSPQPSAGRGAANGSTSATSAPSASSGKDASGSSAGSGKDGA